MWAKIKEFLIWLLEGKVCPECNKERVLGHGSFHSVCRSCSSKNWTAYYAREDRKESEKRINEMAEAIRRASPVAVRKVD